ncbi:MAG: glycosyltransferase, partial [Candidatus Lokiarchaeota archaeon]|nr:glycosyltransferase [Candidatus Lokiarchaeota archaeon]
MKILFITEKWFPEGGGGEIYFYNLTKKLEKHGHKIYIISGSPIDTNINNHINIIYEVDVKHNYRSHSITSIIGRIKYIFQILLKLNSMKIKDFDLIHTTSPVASFISSIIGYLFNIPVIISVLTFGGYKWPEITHNRLNGFIYRLIERFSLKIMPKNMIISISKEFLKYLVKIGIKREKIKYIPNAINLDIFSKHHTPIFKKKYKISNNKIILGYLGALEKVKDVSSILYALKKLNDDNKFFLFIAGNGSQKLKLLKLSNELNLKNCIFLDKINYNSVPNFLESINILILPSISEGFPTVCLESIALNKLIISTKIETIQNLIIHGKNGYIINPNKDKVDEIYKYCKDFEKKYQNHDDLD